MAGYSGAWRNSLTVAEPAPLGKADTEIHLVEDTPVTRDDAPQTTALPEWLTRDEQLRAGAGKMIDPDDQRSHDSGGMHGSHNDQTIGTFKEAPPWINYQHQDFGGDHTGQPVKGSAGAAHGGLRADNSSDWANPDGFALGKEYTPMQLLRQVFNGRMRGMLRPYGPNVITDGTQSQPVPTDNPAQTSPFDLTARVTQGHGTSNPTQRHTTRPNEGDVRDPQVYAPQSNDFASQWVAG